MPKVVITAEPPSEATWAVPYECCSPFSCYTCCCTLCAAADVEDHVLPGSWWSKFCTMYCCAAIPYCGICVVLCNMRVTARAKLAQMYGIKDTSGGVCNHCCCAPCLLEQELQQIKSGAARLAMQPNPVNGVSKQ
jgi:hypothetical protein